MSVVFFSATGRREVVYVAGASSESAAIRAAAKRLPVAEGFRPSIVLSGKV